MTPMLVLALYFVGAFVLSAVIGLPIIKGLKRIRAGQNILEYVVQHEAKAGTPTMGGIIFIIPIVIACLIEFTPTSLVAMSLMIGFGLVGFLDDFIKIKLSRNLGLKAYQKIFAQVGLSAIGAYFVFASKDIGAGVNIPYVGEVDLGWGIIPFVLLIYIATTNSVNLTDGLDGLAGITSVGYFIVFAIILAMSYFDKYSVDAKQGEHLFSLMVISVVAVGGILGYLIFNTSPAKVFMGDTGSLALGALVASVAVMSKNPIFLILIGIMYVWSSISVIVQVLCFKVAKKRVFLMAPFHHHLEMKGMSESRIGILYFAITMIGGAISLVLAGGI